MARGRPSQASTDTATSMSKSSTTNNTARIRKTRTEGGNTTRTTRQRSRMLAEASSNGVLQSMVNEASCERDQEAASAFVAEHFGGTTAKGKEKLMEVNDEDTIIHEDFEPAQPELCPITDKDTKSFPIMDLPTEIRLEIYRACLTRPYDILLSKRELPPVIKEDSDSSGLSLGTDVGSDDDETSNRMARVPAARTAAPSDSTSTRRTLPTVRSRRSRLTLSVSAPGSSSDTTTGAAATNPAPTQGLSTFSDLRAARPTRRVAVESRRMAQPEPDRNQSQDPLITNVLRVSKQIYKEARGVLYSENHFVLDLNTAMQTLGHLHQRSRRQIKHIELEIPTYNEILERFQETVRLSLRYCSGLKKFIISMPFTLPGADGSGTTGNTTVYANGFDILRWLPQECDVIMQGNICSEIETVVQKHLRLSKTLDKLAYARRQLISNETSSSSPT